MKYVKKQCKQCPFRKTSAPGWLGSYTPSSVFSSIWKGHPFFCHTSIDYDDPEWLEKAMNPRSGKLCVGGLRFANMIHAPDHEMVGREDYTYFPIVIEARQKVRLREDVECMTPQEFGEHHGGQA